MFTEFLKYVEVTEIDSKRAEKSTLEKRTILAWQMFTVLYFCFVTVCLIVLLLIVISPNEFKGEVVSMTCETHKDLRGCEYTIYIDGKSAFEKYSEIENEFTQQVVKKGDILSFRYAHEKLVRIRGNEITPQSSLLRILAYSSTFYFFHTLICYLFFRERILRMQENAMKNDYGL